MVAIFVLIKASLCIFIHLKIYVYLIHMCKCLLVCMNTTCIPGAHTGQKKTLDHLELE